VKETPLTSGGPGQEPSAAQQKLSHEVRSAAQGLLGYLLIFSDEVKPQLNDEQQHVLERINFYAKKMADLLIELLAEPRPPQE
jgi:hypothetical protein